MKVYISRVLTAMFVVSVLLAGAARAQEVKHSPRYRIAYDAGGWDGLPEKVVEKWAAKIERKYGAAAASDWRFQAERLAHFGEWLDEAWSRRVAAWSRCTYVGDVDPGRFFVRVESDTFRLPEYPELTTIWGTVDLSAKNIRVTSWAYIKQLGWPVNAVDTVEWEFGNALQLLKRGAASRISGEIGSGDPCK